MWSPYIPAKIHQDPHCTPDVFFSRNGDESEPEFYPCPPPSPRDLLEVARNVFLRMKRFLKKWGFLSQNGDDTQVSPLDRWSMSTQREPSMLAPTQVHETPSSGIELGGFSVHAAVTVPAHDKKRRIELCRYVTRPPFAEDQLRATEDGRIAFTLRRKAQSGQSVILLEPVRQLRRLAWLIPPARQHQVRFHGILAPAAKDRSRVVAKPPFKLQLAFPLENMHPERSSYRVPWAKLLKRVSHCTSLVHARNL